MFAERHKLGAPQFAVPTPFPGTEMRRQLEGENTIVDHDWSRYTLSNVIFRPRHMTALEPRPGHNRRSADSA